MVEFLTNLTLDYKCRIIFCGNNENKLIQIQQEVTYSKSKFNFIYFSSTIKKTQISAFEVIRKHFYRSMRKF